MTNNIQQAIEKPTVIERLKAIALHLETLYGESSDAKTMREAIALLEAVSSVDIQPKCAECGSDVYMSFDGTHCKCNQDFRGGCSLNDVWRLTKTQDAATTTKDEI